MSMYWCTECDFPRDNDYSPINDEGVCTECVIDKEYLYWEDDNPARTSKSAKPKMGMSGRSLKNVITRIIGKKGRKK